MAFKTLIGILTGKPGKQSTEARVGEVCSFSMVPLHELYNVPSGKKVLRGRPDGVRTGMAKKTNCNPDKWRACLNVGEEHLEVPLRRKGKDTCFLYRGNWYFC